jgi:hypothetical protein
MGYLEGQYGYLPFGIAPWMDDFFTWSMGYLSQLGFSQVDALLQWKAKFVVGRLTNPDYCWLQASVYSLQVGTADKIPFKTWAEIYKANYPTGTCTGTKMDGYPEIATGYGANMQPALAVAVDAGAPSAQAAWDKYQTRAPKQDYSSEPQFDVVPKAYAVAVRDPGTPRARRAGRPWILPGSPVSYTLDRASEVFAEMFDTSGRRLLRAALGRQAKGPHGLDWRAVPGAGDLGKTPCIVRVKAQDDFKHGEYVPVTMGERP